MKNIAIFLAGVAVGGVAGYFIGKIRTEKKVKKTWNKNIKEEYDPERLKKYAKTEEEEKPEREEKEKVRELRNQEKKEGNTHKTDYTSFYQKKGPNEDTVDESVEGEDGPEIDLEADEYHEKNKHRKPKLISMEDFGNLPASYECENLWYYPEEDVLKDEDDNVIEDYQRILGDCLQKFGFDRNEEEEIIVQNFELDTAYDIVKVFE